MGGGESGGGAIVQQTAPWAAMAAGQLGANAAAQASAYAKDATTSAINSINQQYQAASKTLNPYTQTGIQALDQLNQYIGLDPYRPAVSPTNPVKPTLESELGKIKSRDLLNYIDANSSVTGVGNNIGQNFGHLQYFGPGSEDPSLQQYYAGGWQNTPAGEQMPGYGITVAQNLGQTGSNPSYFLGDPNIRNAAKTGLANENLEAAMPGYNIALDKYNQDLANYNQQLAWADQYATPLTQQQITDNITNQPGYQAQLGQGTQAIQNAGSAKGYLGSGRVLKELMNFGQNTLSQYYGDTLQRLAGVANMGQQSASQLAGGQQNQGNALASLYNSLGENQANAALSAGNAQAQAMIAANQQYNVMGGGGGGGGMGGIGQVLGGIGSIASAFAQCSKQLKDKVESVKTDEILHSIKQLELDKWKYKGIDREFIGPYAEQFQELFKVGDGKTINMIDAVGVLLSAVKELDRKLDNISSVTTRTL